MVNLRQRTKARGIAPKVVLKAEPTSPTMGRSSDNVDLSEAALRRLSRAELQKLAMAHEVKANMKSELIIRELARLGQKDVEQNGKGNRRRPAEDEERGPSRKRLKRETASEEAASIPKDEKTPEEAAPAPGSPVQQTSVEDPPPPPPEGVRSLAQEPPVPLSYDEGLFSGTESEMTDEGEDLLDFATPVSSRSGTPPPANAKDLERCVTIMQEISEKDVALLKEVMGVRETAAKLRKRARNVRELVKAERGRRERMETYFRYWQEIEPAWDRQWLYGEQTAPDESEVPDEPAGPPTIPLGGRAQLSPEEVKLRRAAIIAKQDAERRQLEAQVQ